MNSEEIKKTLELHGKQTLTLAEKEKRIDELAMLKIAALNNIADAIWQLARCTCQVKEHIHDD